MLVRLSSNVFLNRHPFRRDRVNFIPGVWEAGHAPRTHIGVELLEDLKIYGMKRVYNQYNEQYGPYTGGWKKRSIFWDLPY